MSDLASYTMISFFNMYICFFLSFSISIGNVLVQTLTNVKFQINFNCRLGSQEQCTL